MYNKYMFLLQFPNGTKEILSSRCGWRPEKNDIWSNTEGDWVVKHVTWLYPDSCTAIMEPLEPEKNCNP